MPSFSHKDALKFWKEYKDPLIYRVIIFMESVERWTIDNDESLNSALQKLGINMEDIGNIDIGKKDEFIKVAAFIRMSRMLYIMQCLDTAHPGAASKLLTHAENSSQSPNDVAGIFLRRNVVFERLRLLSRLFSPERLALVQQALEDENIE